MLSENAYAPKYVSDLLADRRWGGRPAVTLVQALCMMAGADQIHPAQDADDVTAAAPRCASLNAYICHRARYGDSMTHLASPVTGGGIFVDRFEQLFLASRRDGGAGAAAWAEYAWNALAVAGQRFVKDGVVVETADDNVKELGAQAATFNITKLPLLRALGIA